MALRVADATERPADAEPVSGREAWRDGAMRIDAAEEFSGLRETELYALMDAGQIAWFPKGAKRIRMIARASLVDYLHAQQQQHTGKAQQR